MDQNIEIDKYELLIDYVDSFPELMKNFDLAREVFTIGARLGRPEADANLELAAKYHREELASFALGCI